MTEAPPPVPKPRRRWLSLLVGLLVMGVFFAGVLEVGLRLFPNRFVTFLPARFDEQLGYVPVTTGNAVWASSCFATRGIHINHLGFRGEDPAEEKTGPRIAVFGDSFMEALQVNNDETFSARLAEKTGAEVLNFGRTGSGQAHAFAIYDQVAAAYEPDIVMAAFLLGNDLLDDWPFQGEERGELRPMPRTVMALKDGEPTLIETERSRDRDLQNALFRFYLPRFIHQVKYRLLDRLRAQFGGGGSGVQGEQTAAPWYGRASYEEFEVYRKPKGKWAAKYAYEADLLAAFRDRVEADGGKFFVFMVPGALEQLPDPEALLETMVPGPIPGDFDVDAAQRRFQRLLEDKGIAVVNPLDTFKSTPQEVTNHTPKYAFPCDGHWTAAGHELGADLAARWLRERGWLPQR